MQKKYPSCLHTSDRNHRTPIRTKVLALISECALDFGRGRSCLFAAEISWERLTEAVTGGWIRFVPDTESLITSAEAAARLNRSVSALHRYVELGQLTPALAAPGIRGAKWFRPEDIDALAATLKGSAA